MGLVSDGDIEALARPDIEPALAAALRDVPPGQLSAPVKTKAGFRVVRCEARKAGQAVTLEQARHRIGMEMKAEAGTAAARKEAADLRAKASVRVDEALLASLAPPPAK